ncbi:UNVERIFIED_CONTAM: hypothetical protein RMT77_006272 [Armadillidium vulgare]
MDVKLEESSEKFQSLLDGLNEDGDCGNETIKPKWLDQNLFNEGRLFYKKYLFCIFLAEYFGLITGAAFKRLLVPVIFTKQSDTPVKSLNRLISTVRHVITWFEEDVWDEESKGFEDLMIVRKTHKIVSSKINTIPDAHLVYDEMRRYERASQCPFKSLSVERHLSTTLIETKLDSNSEQIQYLSQFDMALTQYLFFGIVLSHPKEVGLWWVTDKELEGFVHFWRGIGWLLGIEDKYNLCSGSLENVKSLCHEIEERIIKNELLNLDDVGFAMADITIRGTNKVLPAISFPSVFLYILNIFNVDGISKFRSTMTWRQYSEYLLMTFILKGLLIFPFCSSIFNFLLFKAFKGIRPKDRKTKIDSENKDSLPSKIVRIIFRNINYF